jgi:hypothetical protein
MKNFEGEFQTTFSMNKTLEERGLSPFCFGFTLADRMHQLNKDSAWVT